MTNEEAKVFLDNLKICIDEHPIVADWLVEIADRKTEPSNSEKPNNCDTCKHNKLEWYSEVCDSCCGNNNHYEPKDEPQTCDDCIWSVCNYNKAFEDEPQTYVINPQEPTNDDKCFECDDFFTCGGQCNKIEDEPQAEVDWKQRLCDMYGTDRKSLDEAWEKYEADKPKDEPQTDCAWR